MTTDGRQRRLFTEKRGKDVRVLSDCFRHGSDSPQEAGALGSMRFLRLMAQDPLDLIQINFIQINFRLCYSGGADKALISSGLPYWGSGIVKSTPPITSPALKSLLGLSLCTL